LFTSRSHGRARDPPERIVAATGPAMRELMRLVVEEEARTGRAVAEVRMCRINSGLFAVPWGRSKRVIEEMELGEGEVPARAEGGVVQVVAYERE
jgi:ADP-ribose 1''-phosphate phosphatase